ncbi:MAG: cytochrome C assembly protein [Dehalococcoidia bacterium]|nr:cytochrome C assembly protein [Dehalococcoidia bacterium]
MTTATSVTPGADAIALASRLRTDGGGRTWDTALITVGAVLLLVAGGVAGLLWAPEDAIQKAPQRIFYIHVPTAWVAFLAFFVVFAASIGYLVRGTARWDNVARSSAEIGLLFTTLALITGAIWGKPVWGVWWQWDPRQTSTLVLWMIYAAYVMLRSFARSGSLSPRTARAAAVLGIVGFFDVPLIYFSVEWWRNLHPGIVILTPEGPKMPAEMLISMLISLGGMTLMYAAVLLVRVRLGATADHIEQARAALEEG